jgi:hypothetical protein
MHEMPEIFNSIPIVQNVRCDLPEQMSPIISTVFRPPYSESAKRPHNIPVQTCAAVLDPTIIPA